MKARIFCLSLALDNPHQALDAYMSFATAIASEVPEVVGSGEEDLRCRSLLTVCQRRLGLSQTEDTRLEWYSFFGREDELVVWRGCGET